MSIGWMLTYDVDLNPIVPEGKRTRESGWARIAFATERRDLTWAGAFLVGLFCLLAIVLDRTRVNTDLHGGAGWATKREIRRSALRQTEYGIVLGQTKSGELLIHSGEENVLAIGPPGEGKTDGIARPTLLKTWPYWSAIVFDPANELTPMTAAVRREHTRVRIFDPRDPNTTRYNPLGGIEAGDVDSVRTVLAAYLLERDLSEMTEQERYFNGSALELGTRDGNHGGRGPILLQRYLGERSRLLRIVAEVRRSICLRNGQQIRQDGPKRLVRHHRNSHAAA
jgi:hypothetical protein